MAAAGAFERAMLEAFRSSSTAAIAIRVLHLGQRGWATGKSSRPNVFRIGKQHRLGKAADLAAFASILGFE